jgi:hypothetical protein
MTRILIYPPLLFFAILAVSADEPPKKPYDPDGHFMQPGYHPTGAKPPPGQGSPPVPIRAHLALAARLQGDAAILDPRIADAINLTADQRRRRDAAFLAQSGELAARLARIRFAADGEDPYICRFWRRNAALKAIIAPEHAAKLEEIMVGSHVDAPPLSPVHIRVTAVTVRLLTVPDHDDAMLQIDATGETPGPGWRDAELVPRRGGKTAPDGYREFDLVATPVPPGIRPIVPCPVEAKAAFLVPIGLKGVRVYQPEAFVEEPTR